MKKGSGNVYSSSLPAGQLSDSPSEQLFKIEQFGKLGEPFCKFFSAYAVKRGATAEIVPDGKRHIKRGILKHNSDILFYFLHISVNALAADENLSLVLCELTADY